jgi:hypothetical protein
MTIANQLSVTKFPFVILDTNGQKIYEENSDGTWIKRVYSPEGWQTNYEESTGYWESLRYYPNGIIRFRKTSAGDQFQYNTEGDITVNYIHPTSPKTR